MTDLKPCPFCDNYAILRSHESGSNVSCSHCGATTEFCENDLHAICSWNGRSQPAQPTVDDVCALHLEITNRNATIAELRQQLDTLKAENDALREELEGCRESANSHYGYVLDYQDAVKSLEGKITSMQSELAALKEQPAQQWISVDDKLFPACVEVWVAAQDGFVTSAHSTNPNWFVNKWGITHWMEKPAEVKPKPPAQQGEKE